MNPRIVPSARRIDRSRVRAFNEVVRQPSRQDLMDTLFRAVTAVSGVEEVRIKGRGQDRPVTYARHMLMYCLQSECKLGIAEIGRLLGRDHSTVIAGVKRIEMECRTRPQTMADVDAVREAIAKESEHE